MRPLRKRRGAQASGALVVLWLLLAGTAAAQTEPGYSELPNFHQVNQQLYRGAQPKKGGLRRLASLGIKTIINLRANDEGSQAEQAEAAALGLRYYNIPMARAGSPTDEQVERALSLINATENQPVFVHCQRGQDRTGLIIAIYRITHDGWTSEQAKAEANHYGMRIWQIGKKNYISDYYKEWLRLHPAPAKSARVLAPLRALLRA